MKKVNIAIEEELHSRAKILSVLKGVTLNDYLTAAIEKAVNKDKKLLREMKDG